MKTLTQVFVGVDVSKKKLDVYLLPMEKHRIFENSVEGVLKIQKYLSKQNVQKITWESTGGYDYLLLNILGGSEFKVWQVEPSRIKAFGRAKNIRAKNDRIDSKLIAEFGQTMNGSTDTEKLLQGKKLKELVTTRRFLVREAAKIKQRLSLPHLYHTRHLLEETLNDLQNRITQIDNNIKETVKQDEEIQRKVSLLQTIPGVGEETATTIVSTLPELGKIPNKKIASLVGVAPFTKESGSYVGKARIRNGRPIPRQALFMVVFSGIRYNPIISAQYKKLKDKGKFTKVAMVAGMRKIITIMNSMMRDNKPWEPRMQNL